MLGKRSDQKGLWEADRLYLDYVGQDTCYGLLASLRGQLFSDDDFAEIYGPDNGPGQRAAQPAGHGAAVADLRPGERRRGQGEGRLRHPLEEPALGHDQGWRWGLRLRIDPLPRVPFAKSTLCQEYPLPRVPFAKSTLQLFRAQLILHEKVRRCSRAACAWRGSRAT